MSSSSDEGVLAPVPVDDRGLAYGDGCFETMACVGGRILALQPHLDRLERGCRALGFEPPGREHLCEALAGAAREGDAGVLKLIVTRGSGGRGYAPPLAPVPRIRVSRHPLPGGIAGQRAHGVSVVRLNARLAHHRELAGYKHLNRLEQVLAARELCGQDSAQEGIVFDQEGMAISGVMSNLFLVCSGKLVTPDLSRCGVAGIIRETLLSHSGTSAVPPISVRAISDRDLDQADEIFLTNSIRGVLPVRRLDRHDLGPPGPVASAALRLLLQVDVLM